MTSWSAVRTARISARSTGERWTAPEQIASLRSRVARPARNSSRCSGLRASTRRLLQMLATQDNSTRGAVSLGGRNGPAVQLQQHRARVVRDNFKVISCGEVAALARAQVPVHAEITIGHNANVGERDGCDGEPQERGSCGDYSSRGSRSSGARRRR